ncbi:unnamed protein product [Rotaria socialis]|uniref:Amino acid permease/ SLC12A domain-containing protein n=1 Tax=Rotaria socialis TaxID=392032 RepID=A0A818BY61_9BILA|nr:unnamed protein product [Rotaria socialis]
MPTPMFQYKRGVIRSIGHVGRIVLSPTKHIFKQITERKPMVVLQAEIDTQIEFRRTLNWFHLLAIGVGTMIGAGIFVLSGTAASNYAGPSVIVSFVLTGVIAFLSALSLSELGTMMPLSGSAYTYTYAGSFSKYGVTGMLQASTHIFFAYVGFDSVATVAQEVKSPERSLPIALIGSTIISLLLYVGICTVMVGLVSYEQLNSDSPLTVALQATPYGLWLRIVMTLGGIASLTTVGMTAMLSQTRIFYAMAHDGLLPPLFCKLHPTRVTPWISTLISGIFCAVVSGFFPVDILGETSAIGALIMYIFVHVSVIVMRFTHKDMPRGFEVPCGRWLIPTIGSLLCMLLMKGVSRATAFRFLAWTILGQIFYFSYGYWHSKRRRLRKNEESNSMVVLMSNSENNIDVYSPNEL